jgi:alpha-glucoside transport system substrate-binding protein
MSGNAGSEKPILGGFSMKKLLLAGVAAFALTAISAQAQDLMFPVGEGDFNWDSFEAYSADHDLNGEQVTVFGPWLGPDQEAIEAVLAYFAMATGADVRYVGSDSFEQQIVVDAGSRFGPERRRVPAARPRLRHGQARLPDAARR